MEIQREVPSLPEYAKYSDDGYVRRIFKVSNYTAGSFAATAADIRQRVKSIIFSDMSTPYFKVTPLDSIVLSSELSHLQIFKIVEHLSLYIHNIQHGPI